MSASACSRVHSRRPQETQDCPLLGNPQIVLSGQGRRANAPEDSHLLTVCSGYRCKGQWDPFQGGRPGLEERASETYPRWRLKGRGCSIKLSKDYTGISWAFNSCRTGQRAGPVALTPPTLTPWLTGVRTSSATTPDIKPAAPLPLRPSLQPTLLRLQRCPSSVFPASSPLFPSEVAVLCSTSCETILTSWERSLKKTRG